jgi:hypothetical protein
LTTSIREVFLTVESRVTELRKIWLSSIQELDTKVKAANLSGGDVDGLTTLKQHKVTCYGVWAVYVKRAIKQAGEDIIRECGNPEIGIST